MTFTESEEESQVIRTDARLSRDKPRCHGVMRGVVSACTRCITGVTRLTFGVGARMARLVHRRVCLSPSAVINPQVVAVPCVYQKRLHAGIHPGITR